MSATIRKLKLSEIGIVQTLAREIWPLVYSDMISSTQISYMLNWMYSHEKLRQDMESGVQFMLTSFNNRPIGFVAFEMKQQETFLHKLYLHPKFHGNGHGKELLKRVESQCRDNNSKTIRLTVNRSNKAIEFYIAQGFVIEKEKDFDIGNGFWMNDYIMKKELL
jgi:diamine N-acetyltransferase